MSDWSRGFGRRMQEARQAVEPPMTQTDLATRLKLTRSSVTNIEAGRQGVTAEKVIQIAEFLGCDAGWLLTGHQPGVTRPGCVMVPQGLISTQIVTLRALADDWAAAARKLGVAEPG